MNKHTNVNEQSVPDITTPQTETNKLNVLFVSDSDIDLTVSYATDILNSGLVTGDIVSTQGDVVQLFNLVQNNLTDKYDIVSIMFNDNIPDTKTDTIEVLTSIFNNVIKAGAKLITISPATKEFAPYGYVKYKNTEDIATWMKTEPAADYNIDTFNLIRSKSFFKKNRLALNRDGHLQIAKRWLAFLVKLQPKNKDSIIKKAKQIDDTTQLGGDAMQFGKVGKSSFIMGDKSPKIMLMQRRLRSLDYELDANESKLGKFGKSTYNAVKSFQLINELPSTGEIDALTARNILNSSAKSYSKWSELFTTMPDFIKKLGLGAAAGGAAKVDADSRNIATYKHASGGSKINRKAFLDAIAYAEGTEQYPNNGYYTLFTGKQFDSLAKHPNISICAPIKGKKTCSTAAGRYQFLSSTWKGLGISDFSKTSQDKGALMLLNPKLLAAVDAGEWPTVFTGANRIWASFPGDVYGQGGKTMDQMMKFIETRIIELGGTVTDTVADDDSTNKSVNTGKNGKMSSAELKTIGSGHSLIPKAADAYLEMELAAKKDGVIFELSDSYRTFAVQNNIFDWDRYRKTGEKKKRNTNYAAAYPGTSNHGLGKSIDMFPKKAQDWIKQNGEQYGWSWAEGRSVGEAWHFTYVG